MARRNRASTEITTSDYRHDGVTRKNVPPAKIASEGQVPPVKKAKYYYSPHLDPELRYDTTGEADRVMAVAEKVGQYLTDDERELLGKALTVQQPWLEWAGKKEEHDRAFFEVDPVALHIHERVSAQAIVNTAKREDIQPSLFADPELPYQKEVQFYQHDVDWANRLILGDSLQVMSSLAHRENLAGKVQMIYIDPPYGINYSSNFQSEVGKRDVKEKADDLTRDPEMVRAYRDTWNLGIHSYLAYLRDRLAVARELLTATGSIFVQISDQNLHRLRILMDEIFGPDNLVAQINFKSMGALGQGDIPKVYDYLIWFAKDIKKFKFRRVYRRQTFDGDPEYRFSESAPGTDSGRFYRRSTLTSSGFTPSCTFEFAFGGHLYRPFSRKSWRTNAEGMERLMRAERLFSLGSNLYFKRFADDCSVILYENSWADAPGATARAYVVETAPKFVERCMLMATDPGDLVLDPTCGSGTTPFVAEQWGRRWIAIDTSRVAVALARQRLLTSKYDYYQLRDSLAGVAGSFVYDTVPYITLKSIAQNQNLDPILTKHEPLLDERLSACNAALAGASAELRAQLKRKLLDKQKTEGIRAITDADTRRWLLPPNNRDPKKPYDTVDNDFAGWYHWEVPFDTDPDWPKALQDAVTAYRQAWWAKSNEVNACIAANADQEELVDQPEVVRNVLRVSGPFTVEGVRPEELSMGDEGPFDPTPNEDAPEIVAEEEQNIQAYLSRMVALLKQDGVTFPNNQHRDFLRIDALYEQATGAAIHAEGIWQGGDEGGPNTLAIAFGPQYGPVTAYQVEDLIRAARMYDELVIAGFSFDAEAAEIIQEAQHPKLTIHMAHIRPDVSPGMDGLLKDTPNSQLFTVFGQPEVEVRKAGDDEFEVELIGVDIYDPLKGEVKSTGASKVAAWFLDSNYDGRCFCITQAFFPKQDAWDKIAKALGSSADPEAFEAFKGTVSVPFKAGKHRRIAVKVIDPRGNEVMAVAKLDR